MTIIDFVIDIISKIAKKSFWDTYEHLNTEREFKSFLSVHDLIHKGDPIYAKRIVKLREYMLAVKEIASNMLNEHVRKLFEDINLESLYKWRYSKEEDWRIELS